ncbi:hypothetical protein [Virgibacillus doumboii]|uniref:hypothetical protein n=1 Tax=Virgibacillus doumboii TaxID=2697503 RepID=UPI0013E0E97B|nr:hypothetical protein [Virgibacillus doumboii]
MREEKFIRFLTQQESIQSKHKAINSRLAKARKVERDLEVNLDEVVKDDQKTYELLIHIRRRLNDSNGAYQNAVRKYYRFINQNEFPSLKNYEGMVGISH